jgi:hypothetical protein
MARQIFFKKHGRYPNKTWNGNEYFGPGNDVTLHKPSYPPENIGRRHDIAITIASKIEDPVERQIAYRAADTVMETDMDAWYASLKHVSLKDRKYYAQYQLGIKSGLGRNTYYKFI